MVQNKMDNELQNYTYPMMDIDSYKHMEICMTLVLAAQNKDMSMMY